MHAAADSGTVTMAAAGLEVATGLALVVAPSLFAILVLGGDLDGIGRTVGRLGPCCGQRCSFIR